jgi:L-ascorbate metabolism protein UlaG (beta-lactamase superfamily)
VISGPGEYEVGGVIVKGFLSSSNYGGKDRINTIYYVSLEGMNICFLGALNSTELSKEANEAIEEVDILFVPIGGEGALDPSDAYKLAVNLEPKVIIPMHYGEIGQKDALKMFLKEGGSTSVSPLDKLTIKKKDLEGKESEIVVLSPTNS